MLQMNNKRIKVGCENLKRRGKTTRRNKALYRIKGIDYNERYTDYGFDKAIERIKALYPNATRISENAWSLDQESISSVNRKKQLQRAYRMSIHSVNDSNGFSPGHYHYRMHSASVKGLMPPGYGGYYVCSKNRQHMVYVIGPLYDRRCHVHGCNGKLRLI